MGVTETKEMILNNKTALGIDLVLPGSRLSL